ncbi:hypothetical protein QBC45DRAFT_168920 [Copromyces sp. CBS 386.78]|nr:hypothetical protein QBC45DRAFT_168920 [Copromyces sp. CBS 386.78]
MCCLLLTMICKDIAKVGMILLRLPEQERLAPLGWVMRLSTKEKNPVKTEVMVDVKASDITKVFRMTMSVNFLGLRVVTSILWQCRGRQMQTRTLPSLRHRLLLPAQPTNQHLDPRYRAAVPVSWQAVAAGSVPFNTNSLSRPVDARTVNSKLEYHNTRLLESTSPTLPTQYVPTGILKMPLRITKPGRQNHKQSAQCITS